MGIYVDAPSPQELLANQVRTAVARLNELWAAYERIPQRWTRDRELLVAEMKLTCDRNPVAAAKNSGTGSLTWTDLVTLLQHEQASST